MTYPPMSPYGGPPPEYHGPVRPRLWRSTRDKMVAGVVGGLAEKFDIESSFARTLFAALSLFSGAFPGFVIYAILWLVTREHDVPPEPGSRRFLRR